MKRRGRHAAAAALFCLLAVCGQEAWGGASADGPSDGGAAGERDASSLDVDEAAEFAAALATGDLSPAEVLGAAEGDDRVAAARSRITVRARSAAGVATLWTGGCVDAGGFELRLRRRNATGEPAAAPDWALSRRTGRLAVAAGGLGLAHGFGLLAAAPGAWSSLAAGSTLASLGTGWRTYAGDDARAVRGAAAALEDGPLRGTLAVGRGGGCEEEPVRMLQLESGGRSRAALLLMRRGGGRGASLCGAVGGGDGRLAGEVAAWRPSAEAAALHAWMGRARASAGRLVLEVAAAGMDPGFDPPAGARPALLLAPGGRGWALRLRAGLGPGAVASGLVAAADARGWRSGGVTVTARRQGEIRLRLRPAGGPWLEAGWRWRSDSVRDWGEVSPWLPAAPARLQRRCQFDVTARDRRGALEWRLGLRVLDLQDAAAVDRQGRRRSLLSLRLEWAPLAGWRLLYGDARAWGAPVDLLSVATPAPGVVVPRHWGGWSAEASLGVQHRAGRLLASLGGARRRPAPGGGDRQIWEVSATVALRW